MAALPRWFFHSRIGSQVFKPARPPRVALRIVADDLCNPGCGVESPIAGGRDLIPGNVEDIAIRERRVLHVVARPGGVPRVCVSVLSMTAREIETSKLP